MDVPVSTSNVNDVRENEENKALDQGQDNKESVAQAPSSTDKSDAENREVENNKTASLSDSVATDAPVSTSHTTNAHENEESKAIDQGQADKEIRVQDPIATDVPAPIPHVNNIHGNEENTALDQGQDNKEISAQAPLSTDKSDAENREIEDDKAASIKDSVATDVSAPISHTTNVQENEESKALDQGQDDKEIKAQHPLSMDKSDAENQEVQNGEIVSSRDPAAMDVPVPISQAANVHENEENKELDQGQDDEETRAEPSLSMDKTGGENQELGDYKIVEGEGTLYTGGFSEQDLHILLEKVFKQSLVEECVDNSLAKRELTPQEMVLKIDDSENEVLNGKQWVKDPSCGLKFTDEVFLSKQKKVLGYFLRSMGKNFLEGKSIMSISMPITLFGTESMLTRFASTLAFGPSLLSTAGQQTTPLEGLKHVVAFYFSTLHMSIGQVKPFNPIIGETHQGYLAGIPIVSEQICHHPAISAIYMKTEDYIIHGTQQIDASLGPNSASAVHKRRLCVSLPKLGMDVSVFLPLAAVSGITIGKRTFNWTKKMRIFEPNHLLYAEIKFNPDDKGMISRMFSKRTVDADVARGTIYKVKQEFMDMICKKEGAVISESKVKFVPKEHAVEELATIEGSWLSHLDISGERVWDLSTMKGYKLIDTPNKALPSDSNFREDLIYVRLNDLAKGQESKDKLENIQRADRKLREALSKKK